MPSFFPSRALRPIAQVRQRARRVLAVQPRRGWRTHRASQASLREAAALMRRRSVPTPHAAPAVWRRAPSTSVPSMVVVALARVWSAIKATSPGRRMRMAHRAGTTQMCWLQILLVAAARTRGQYLQPRRSQLGVGNPMLSCIRRRRCAVELPIQTTHNGRCWRDDRARRRRREPWAGGAHPIQTSKSSGHHGCGRLHAGLVLVVPLVTSTKDPPPTVAAGACAEPQTDLCGRNEREGATVFVRALMHEAVSAVSPRYILFLLDVRVSSVGRVSAESSPCILQRYEDSLKRKTLSRARPDDRLAGVSKRVYCRFCATLSIFLLFGL